MFREDGVEGGYEGVLKINVLDLYGVNFGYLYILKKLILLNQD